jgi:hypothetical protein
VRSENWRYFSDKSANLVNFSRDFTGSLLALRICGRLLTFEYLFFFCKKHANFEFYFDCLGVPPDRLGTGLTGMLVVESSISSVTLFPLAGII